MRYTSLIICILVLAGCSPSATVTTGTPSSTGLTLTNTTAITPVSRPATPADELEAYAFPQTIDVAGEYLFYLHGRIVEDQGIHAVSETYGKYEYQAILEELQAHGFTVISEQRPKNADLYLYARKTVEQINRLLEAGVPAERITVIGASKGAGIAVWVSYLLKNKNLKFILLGFCDPDTVEELRRYQVSLYGDVLSIYDSEDEWAGTCQEIYAWSEGKGIAEHGEIVLHVGSGHGILYKPLDEWILPSVEWARKDGNP